MLKNDKPMVGTTSDSTTVYACAWPTDRLEGLEQDRRWQRIARTYGIELSFADFGDIFEGVSYSRLFVTAATTGQAHLGKGYILAMSDAIDVAPGALSESPEELAKRLYPLRPSPEGGPLASVESRSMVACVASAIAVRDEQWQGKRDPRDGPTKKDQEV